MGEITNLSDIMKKKREEENKEVKFGDDTQVATPEEVPKNDFVFGDEPSGISKKGPGFTFPEGVGSGLSKEQLEELKKQAIDGNLSNKNGSGPKL